MSVQLNVSISKEMIAAGIPRSSSCCPIKLAVSPIFPASQVARNYILPNIGSTKEDRIYLPENARDFITKFDKNYKSLMPFDFSIQIPDSVVDAINIEALRPLLENHSTLEIV